MAQTIRPEHVNEIGQCHAAVNHDLRTRLPVGGIVDQQIDCPEPRQRQVDNPLHLTRLVQVGPNQGTRELLSGSSACGLTNNSICEGTPGGRLQCTAAMSYCVYSARRNPSPSVPPGPVIRTHLPVTQRPSFRHIESSPSVQHVDLKLWPSRIRL
ncbi:hypothetical protein [Nocardia xishanensis]